MIQENVKITVNIRDFMAPWGDNQDAAEWYSYHEDDYDYLLDFLNAPTGHTLNSTISRLSFFAWNFNEEKLQIKAVKKLASELASNTDATKYDHEHLVGLWKHNNDAVADTAKQASSENPPSRGKAYSIEMMLAEDDYPDCQILACEILEEIYDKRIAETLYSLVTRVRADFEARERAMSVLCGFGNLSYFKRIHELCHDEESVAVSSDLERLLENFHRVEDKTKRAVEYAGIVNWILATDDGIIDGRIHHLAIGVVVQLGYFRGKKSQRAELVGLLESIANGDSDASGEAKATVKVIDKLIEGEGENKERGKNRKETGIGETDSERKSREEQENIDRERGENFNETGIKETDRERKQREDRVKFTENLKEWKQKRKELKEAKKERNFKETGFRETDRERRTREMADRQQNLQNQRGENLKEIGFRETDRERQDASKRMSGIWDMLMSEPFATGAFEIIHFEERANHSDVREIIAGSGRSIEAVRSSIGQIKNSLVDYTLLDSLLSKIIDALDE